MPKTAVGLFKNPRIAEGIVHDIEAIGFPRKEVRALSEPLDLAITGVISMPHLEFELDLARELLRIGATKPEAEAWVDGVRHGGALVFATGEEKQVDTAAEIMSRRNGSEVEEVEGLEPHLPAGRRDGMSPGHESSFQAGRVRYSGPVGMFVW